MQIIDISISGMRADNCDTAELVTAMNTLKTHIRQFAESELHELEKHRETLLSLINDGPANPPVESRKSRAPGTPKYMSPNNSDLTWTGRGKKPEWMAAWIAKGNDPNDLLIAA
jgi:DNA-binding protein H-NS